MEHVDWAATGTMLQGVGTILGAVAVLVAAAIGGTTFNTWKKQQLLQRQMELAEKILSGAFKARKVITDARTPIIFSHEIEESKKQINANPDLANLPEFLKSKYINAQALLNRISNTNQPLLELEELKALSFAYFGDRIHLEIDKILSVVSEFRMNANIIAQDDGLDRDQARKFRRVLTSSRVESDPDEYAELIDGAVAQIEQTVTPFLREASSSSRSLVDDLPSTIIEVLVRSIIPRF